MKIRHWKNKRRNKGNCNQLTKKCFYCHSKSRRYLIFELYNSTSLFFWTIFQHIQKAWFHSLMWVHFVKTFLYEKHYNVFTRDMYSPQCELFLECVCVCAYVFVCVLYRALAMPLSYSLQVWWTLDSTQAGDVHRWSTSIAKTWSFWRRLEPKKNIPPKKEPK